MSSGIFVVSEQNLEKLRDFLEVAETLEVDRLYVRLELPRTDEIISKIYLLSANSCPRTDVRILVKSENPEDCLLIGDEKPVENTGKVPKKYKKVVLGGTFDRLHNGHKVLLNKAIELASEEIVVGVTDKEMIIKKSLFEMIEPVDYRMKKVIDFVEDVSGEAKCTTEPIIDPFGPSTRIPDLEAIIVSRETLKGGDAVNKKRNENGMTQLDVIVVELVEGSDEILNEIKISSSSKRREELGRLLKPVANQKTPGTPYFVNLNGGSGSGIEQIEGYLKEKNGIEVVNWDVLDSDEKMKVFENNSRISNIKVIVLTSSAPVEAAQISEIWTIFVPASEAIRRIIQRNEITEEEAQKKLSSEMPNKERIERSHVALCTLWNEKETRNQVDKAVRGLMKRL
ncbi:hypothetical protein GCK72_001176 [Caenorhabditis remanei]|uniref:Cytidyltransferase-like domain-containing protein n=1 Tax=Caenorhabditis remanei TaxID=31234 RepID=A0A6A5HNX6_CAERE|nr:hypothetical protein GCK72_001176 [Caenorhabditis remanei]KAF1769359.1 hypothetical protein GCK72_001176 [Caenorhabditis remanei]